jgi:Protein of unknown function (DUF1761)
VETVPVNYVAVVVAAIAAFLTGWGWYAVFGQAWMRGLGRTKAEMRRRPLPFILALLANLLMAWMLAGIIGHLHDVTLKGALISALFVWAGFVATTTLVNQQFQDTRPVVTAIDAGHWLAVLIVMGAILGAFGPG